MARKRKKSRSKKQRKATGASDATSTDALKAGGDEAVEDTSEDQATDEVAAVAIDDEHETSIADARSAVVAMDQDDPDDVVSPPQGESEPEIVMPDDFDDAELDVISLDDDEESHERLIAEAVAFAAAKESDIDTPAPQDAIEGEADLHELAVGEGPHSSEDAAPIARPATTSGLSLTRDAVAALSEMQAQGLIDLPEDLVIDLGEATTDDERDRLLAAALAHVELQEARFRVPTDRRRTRGWKGTAASALVMLTLLVALAPPAILVPDPPAQLTESDLTYGVVVALILQAQQIDAFRAREQRLPDSLDDLGTVLPDIRYVKSSNRLYQLVAYTSDGIAVVYDSAAPAAIFERIAETWVTTQAGA